MISTHLCLPLCCYLRIKSHLSGALRGHPSIQGGLLFFRTSATARAMPHFLNETRMFPPHAYSVCVRTLVDLASSSNLAYHKYDRLVEVHFADEEGDLLVVLNAEGYIPLDEMLWTATSVYTASASEVGSVYSSMDGDAGDDVPVDSDSFKVVHRPKGRKRAALQASTTGACVLPVVQLRCYLLPPKLATMNAENPNSFIDLRSLPRQLLELAHI
ncbi:hypothetical protein WOLCODRAFT_144259 [Wolfiporia cocos MD-104 SS10]|uniref:PB1 domain-containing protein n=1 Tax=Wolfiporia cocos (strain MD-104) TaxID=742152 RepID=A0A2H3JYD8_WOLCO|nr:hypothetical protein WOLCODRAFT_144259 [Wolfiporia cocos MD-104 SS10]